MTTRARRVLIAGLVALAGCSGSDDATAPTQSDRTPSSASPTAEPTVTDETTGDTTSPTSVVTAATEVTLATVPDEGVPGIDSEDPFCNAWSRFAGSFQALAFASSFAADPIRLEVAASDAIVSAVADLDESLPAELGSERDLLLRDLLGPFSARAAQARQALVDAGMDAEQIEALGETWLAAIAVGGLHDADLVLEIPVASQAAFDAAVVAFGAEVDPIVADRSLVTDASAPMTEAHIAETCPDQGILGGNDVVEP